MGYTTEFNGRFEFNKPLTEQLAEYINRFSSTRRMPRDNEKIKAAYPNWRELCFFGELGRKGEYFAPTGESYGDNSVLDFNGYGGVQPGLWCQWVVSDDRCGLEWDEGEKFYEYVEWLEYLINHFFAPLGYVLNGSVDFYGEDSEDFGVITVVDNKVNIGYGISVTSLQAIDDKTLLAEVKRRGYNIVE